MKFTKMSLVAALLVGSSAFAIENTKVGGDAKLYYSATNQGKLDLFNKGNAMGEAALDLGLTTDLTKNISAGVSGTVITTLGLYNNLVSATWTGGVEDTYVINEAWVAGTYGKTTLKVGRQKLDTPLVFTETWSIVENTFEAAVVINQDLPDTTLVGAYVGQHDSAQVMPNGTGMNQTTSPFASFYNGAYAAGVVNNSFKPVVAQAWYYGAQTNDDVGTLLDDARFNGMTLSHLDAFWLQADLDASSLGVAGLTAGLQYTKNTYDLKNAGGISSLDNDALALMVGYSLKDVATFKLAYSQVGTEKVGGLGAGFNLATLKDGNGVATGTAQSKLYTEAWWNYGYVTRADTSAFTLSAEGNAMDVDLGAYYTQTSAGNNGSNTPRNEDMTELTLTAGKSFGPLDASLAYIYTKADDANIAAGATKGSAFSTVQAYLTLNF